MQFPVHPEAGSERQMKVLALALVLMAACLGAAVGFAPPGAELLLVGVAAGVGSLKSQ